VEDLIEFVEEESFRFKAESPDVLLCGHRWQKLFEVLWDPSGHGQHFETDNPSQKLLKQIL
jgi:hypothetical protein